MPSNYVDVEASVSRSRNRYAFNCPECQNKSRVPVTQRMTKKTCYRCRSVMRVRVDHSNANGTNTVNDPDGNTIPSRVTLKIAVMSRGSMLADPDLTPETVELTLKAQLESVRTTYMAELKKDVMKAAREEMASMAPQEIILAAPNVAKPTTVDGTRHPLYGDIMEALAANGQAMMVGPPGSGKSTMGKLVAGDLKLDFVYYSCSEGLSEAHLLGRMDVNGKYIPSALVRALENPKGAVILFDEIDGMDANSSLVINELLANRRMSLPNRPRKPDVQATFDKHLILCGANTWGTGTSVEHTGRNTLDAALLDRFVGVSFWMDYDETLETQLGEARGSGPLMNVLWKVRSNVRDARIRRPVSTRAIINLGNLHLLNPSKYTYRVLLDRFFTGWSDQERAKAMHGIDIRALSDGTQDESANDAPGTDTDADGNPLVKVCPECGKRMTKRVATRGRHKGRKFWGCTGFPQCRHLIAIPKEDQ